MPEEAGVGHITIRDLDESVFETLRTRAELHGRSVEDEAREVLAQSVRQPLSPEERLAVAKRICAMTPPGSRPSAEDLIRQDRDRR